MAELSSTASPGETTPLRKVPVALLAGPIVPAMLRLALPTVVVLVAQTFVGVAETYFVSSLGTEVLAGVALVFPVLMLMQMTSNGGLGGGVASAVARAQGAGRRADANALVWHSVVVAGVFGAVFTVAMILGGPALYRAMGGGGQTLSTALTYSNMVFAGSVPIWIVALLSATLRGVGEVRIPALITLAGAGILLPLSPVLIFGWGPFPRLGVAGAGVAIVVYYALAALLLIGYLRSTRSPLRLSVVRLDARLFKDILGVGLLSAVGTVQVNLTVAIVTAAVGRFGADAIAGYGIASRLDYVQIPLLFGLGTAIVTMVGVNLGAGQTDRALRIAWIGAAIAFSFTELIGLAAATFPNVWLGLFSDDPQVLSRGESYLRNVAPVYGAIGAGMALYFASQATKRVLWPVLAGTARMIIAAGVGWWAVTRLGADLPSLFQIVALAAAVFCAITVSATFASGRAHRSAIRSAVQPDPAE